ncbi:alpha-mannosidase-like protein [Tanacetum coccineum]
MREGEAEKQKQYAALVWISHDIKDDGLIALSSLKDLLTEHNLSMMPQSPPWIKPLHQIINALIAKELMRYPDMNNELWANVLARLKDAVNELWAHVEALAWVINLRAYVEDGSKELSVLVDRAVGGSSLADGQIELMLHRRLLFDDAKGVGEVINETICVVDDCKGLVGLGGT